ncbi:unnamed protein product [Arabidopsis halleri]
MILQWRKFIQGRKNEIIIFLIISISLYRISPNRFNDILLTISS